MQYYIHKSYHCQNKHGRWVKKSFIQAWIHDPNKRNVASVSFDPECKSQESYNIWRGYFASRLNPMEYFLDKADIKNFVMKPIIQHLDEVITGGDKAQTEYLLDWMASILQRPWMKTQVAICLSGTNTCGEAILFDWFRMHVIGKEHSNKILDVKRDLFSRFSDGFVGKTFIQVDSVNCLSNHSCELKDLITRHSVTWEQRHYNPVQIQNHCNFILTLSDENALAISNDDRHFVIFRCSSAHKGDCEYFDSLVKHLHTPGVNVGFYKYLMERDLSKYPGNFQALRPITAYYEECQKSAISPVNRFLSALVNSNVPNIGRTSTVMFDHFKRWCEFQNYMHAPSHTLFGREMNKVLGVERRKTHGNMFYDLDLLVMKKSLIECNEYDEDAYDIEGNLEIV
jgi:hypothetical protein